MRALWEKLSPLHPRAREVALTGLRLTVLLLSCALLLLWLGSPSDLYITQYTAAMRDVARAVLLITAIGTVWIQTLYGNTESQD